MRPVLSNNLTKSHFQIACVISVTKSLLNGLGTVNWGKFSNCTS